MDKIEIFSNTDDRLKFLGKMLNNDSSRKILSLLVEHELTANEISLQTELSLSLILHHLNKMMQAGIVTISKTSMNTKNQPMKYYTAKSGIIILPEKASKKARESKSFTNSLKTIMKFAVIGLVGFFTWFYDLNHLTEINKEVYPGPFEPSLQPDPIIPALIIIIIGLIIERILSFKKRKKD